MKKTRTVFLTLFTFVSAITLTACAPGALSKKDLEGTQLTIDQFFYDNYKGKVDENDNTNAGATMYRGVFNEVNFSQLERPSINFRSFCEAKGGVFSKYAANERPAARLANPEFTSNDVYHIEKSANKIRGLASASANFDAAIFADNYQKHFVDVNYPQKYRDVINLAEKKDAFGGFVCLKGADAQWSVIISPQEYEPAKDPTNALDNPILWLMVKVTKGAEK